MMALRILLNVGLALGAGSLHATETFSLQPANPVSGQSVTLRIDDTSGCFRFDDGTLERAGSEVRIDLWLSDFFEMPCPARHVTPVLVPLGAFPAGNYNVSIRTCVIHPTDPCDEAAVLGLSVANLPRPTSIPAFGWVALLLSSAGILALAFTTRPAAPPR